MGVWHKRPTRREAHVITRFKVARRRKKKNGRVAWEYFFYKQKSLSNEAGADGGIMAKQNYF